MAKLKYYLVSQGPGFTIKRVLSFIYWRSRFLLTTPKTKQELCVSVKNIGFMSDLPEPLVSVVIPVYDRPELAAESILSSLNQRYRNFEVIVVFDGSSDTTIDYLTSFVSNNRLRFIRLQQNSGNPVRPRNIGICNARGEFIALLDSDDLSRFDRLDKSVEVAIRFGADVVYSNYSIEQLLPFDSLNRFSEVSCSLVEYEELKKRNPICQSTVLVRSDLFRRVGLLKEEMKYCEDLELWQRCAFYNSKFALIEDSLVTYRLHEKNLEKEFKTNKDFWQHKALELHKLPGPDFAFYNGLSFSTIN